jgi:hypothetical protein
MTVDILTVITIERPVTPSAAPSSMKYCLCHAWQQAVVPLANLVLLWFVAFSSWPAVGHTVCGAASPMT